MKITFCSFLLVFVSCSTTNNFRQPSSRFSSPGNQVSLSTFLKNVDLTILSEIQINSSYFESIGKKLCFVLTKYKWYPIIEEGVTNEGSRYYNVLDEGNGVINTFTSHRAVKSGKHAKMEDAYFDDIRQEAITKCFYKEGLVTTFQLKVVDLKNDKALVRSTAFDLYSWIPISEINLIR